MTTAFVVVFTNASLLITAFVFDLFKYSLYMSLLSISFGVFYPVAAILVLVATIYVEASFKYDTGFSAMICTIAGGLMLIFYVSLIFYDRQYIKRSLTSWPNENKHKHSSGSKELGRDHASKLDQSLFETTLKKTGVNPVREWGLRRL
ncbi:uncharacterized protein LOC132732386 [Ruditapes philippinarum]|uniref:uncharacterized protein LOC132732385 n=1 Tax=Ruditapes philippinarum TaxID=129788 RepID=UPI00295BDE22|nr:uncharacterized protein LOC132732385 [Ruditapes philippinarum]XP_060574778.1 uncharacterized protein LOC132732386 [Ruditapes philippinarum]